jgi:hypothetical protein
MSDLETEWMLKIASGEIQPTLAFINFLWALGMLVVSFAIQMLVTPKAEKPTKATIQDFDYPQFEESTPQAVYFGDNWSPDFFVSWYGNLRTSAIKSSGGKK